MKVSLSTAASPGAALDALGVACQGRGLNGIELVLEPGDDLEATAERVRASGVQLVALRVEQLEPSKINPLARLSGALSVPLSVPHDRTGGTSLPELAQRFKDAGGSLLYGVGTDLAQVLSAKAELLKAENPASIGLAWEIRPGSEALSEASAVLLALREHLRLVRLYGGGPEQREQDGRGIGPLFVDLAISGYGGSVVLTPSTPEELPRWGAWLASRKSAGCGSGHPPLGEHELDIRDVEPRDRLSMILGAFGALPRGATLRITLDHDPSCMYYALEESQPQGSFAFRKIGDGPQVWNAEVTKV